MITTTYLNQSDKYDPLNLKRGLWLCIARLSVYIIWRKKLILPLNLTGLFDEKLITHL